MQTYTKNPLPGSALAGLVAYLTTPARTEQVQRYQQYARLRLVARRLELTRAARYFDAQMRAIQPTIKKTPLLLD